MIKINKLKKRRDYFCPELIAMIKIWHHKLARIDVITSDFNIAKITFKQREF